MRAILDTNVVVSGIFFGGVPGEALEAGVAGAFELVVSPKIFDEYWRTCERLADKHPLLSFEAPLLTIIGRSSLAPDPDSDISICRDPDDDKFLLCARDSGARVVSGDRDLLEASGWEGVIVLPPRDFLRQLPDASPGGMSRKLLKLGGGSSA